MLLSKDTLYKQISELIMGKNYPCVAAVKSLVSKDYQLGVYQNFGTGQSSKVLAQALVQYAQEFDKTKSLYFTYWAVFDDDVELNDAEFEARLWAELSALAARPEYSKKWDPHFSSDPKDKNFCFSLNERAYFVVGLHKNSSRISRQFGRPALVFNLYEQFRMLEERNLFNPMIEKSRERDEKYQGYANPVVVNNGNAWEAIQFSGRQNDENWRCPFSKVFSFFNS